MADAKISALPAAALPLAGTEVLPIVQSASTKKVSVDDLTVKNVRSNATTGILQVAGPGASTTRVMTVPNANFTAARTDAAQTFSGTQTFAGSNIYNVINNTGAPGSNASPSFVGTQFLGNASRLIAQTDGGDCSNSSFRGVYRIQTSDDGSATMNTRMQFNGSTDITISTVNLKFDDGKGIDFSATTEGSGTMTSELFNDYEEGNWTPVIRFGGGTTDITYTTQQGRYTKIGRTVTIRFEILLSNKGSSTGEWDMTGLPFNAANLNSLAVYLYSGFDATYKVGIAYLNAGAINEIAVNGSAPFSNTQFTNTSRFWGTCTYQV